MCKALKGKKTTCCTKKEKCQQGVCVPKNPCKAANATACKTRAGLLCCGPDQICGKNQCLPKVGEPDTCDVGFTSCTNVDGTDCCSESETCSSGICVSNTFCIGQDVVTCNTAGGLLCCGKGQTCTDTGCSDDQPNTCVPGTTLCVNIDSSACCTFNQTCSAGLCVARSK